MVIKNIPSQFFISKRKTKETLRLIWWLHQIETFSALLATCVGNSPVTGEFPAHRPVTRSFDVFFDLRLNKRLNKQSWGWWFETSSHPLWRNYNGRFDTIMIHRSLYPGTWFSDNRSVRAFAGFAKDRVPDIDTTIESLWKWESSGCMLTYLTPFTLHSVLWLP